MQSLLWYVLVDLSHPSWKPSPYVYELISVSGEVAHKGHTSKHTCDWVFQQLLLGP